MANGLVSISGPHVNAGCPHGEKVSLSLGLCTFFHVLSSFRAVLEPGLRFAFRFCGGKAYGGTESLTMSAKSAHRES